MIDPIVPTPETRPAIDDEKATGIEWWLAVAALLAAALVPALAKGQSPDPAAASPFGEVLWSIIYVLAGVRLLGLARDNVLAIVRRSGFLWAFVLFMLLSTVWSVNPTVTFKNAVELVGTTIVALYFVVRYPLGRLVDLFALAFGTIAVLSLIVVFAAPGHGRMDWGTGAWSGVFQEKNNLGSAMVLAVITLTVSLLKGSPRRRWLTGGTLLLCLALLVESRSATATAAGIIAIILGLAVWLWCSPGGRVIGRLVVAMAGACVVLITLVVGFRPEGAAEMLGRSSTLTGRTDFWPYLVSAITNRPFLGYGYKAFFRSPEGTDYLSYYVVQAGGWSPYHAHDTFLQVGLDGGFAGLALLGAVLIVALVRAVRFIANERTPLATWPLMIVLCIILASFTETYLANYNSYEWILFVAALLYPVRPAERAASLARERLVAVGNAASVRIPGRG